MSSQPMAVVPFTIDIPEAILTDLQDRLRRSRLPDQIPGIGWKQGTDRTYLKPLITYWAETFDWRAVEARWNQFAQFRATIDGVSIHFVHERARGGAGIPVILTHGWPSAFSEYLSLVPLLTDPDAHGIDGPAFDVVIPSLPGYGFSERPARMGVDYRYVAGLWHRLMRGLGYDRYGAGGGDFGAGATTYMALTDPAPLIGIHLSTPEMEPYLGADAAPLTPPEREYETVLRAWDAVERGYSSIQSTKPQTLGYALNDSPVGLAAWILEKWRSWADTGGDLARRFPQDDLLALVTLYWVTESITTSVRDYYDNRHSADVIGPDDRVSVPTGVASFISSYVFEGDPPREWFERLYDVRRFTRMPGGGHFAAAEEPELLAADIAAFFAELA